MKIIIEIIPDKICKIESEEVIETVAGKTIRKIYNGDILYNTSRDKFIVRREESK